MTEREGRYKLLKLLVAGLGGCDVLFSSIMKHIKTKKVSTY